MSIYLTGDVHGAIKIRFNEKYEPYTSEFTANDIVFALGDIGIFFNPNMEDETIISNLKFLNSKPYTIVFIRGNHDNVDMWEDLPEVEKWNGKVRQCVFNGVVYDNIYFIPHTTVLDVEDKHILCIGGAESHDIWNLLDPSQPNYEEERWYCEASGEWFRVIGETWWPNEGIDTTNTLLALEGHLNDHFDMILTHDFPGIVNEHWKRYGTPARAKNTNSEDFLETLRQKLNFDYWYHGHAHEMGKLTPDKRLECLYLDWVKI
jgi:hypothetical protein